MKKITKKSMCYKLTNESFEKWWNKKMGNKMPHSKYLARKAWFASRGFYWGKNEYK